MKKSLLAVVGSCAITALVMSLAVVSHTRTIEQGRAPEATGEESSMSRRDESPPVSTTTSDPEVPIGLSEAIATPVDDWLIYDDANGLLQFRYPPNLAVRVHTQEPYMAAPRTTIDLETTKHALVFRLHMWQTEHPDFESWWSAISAIDDRKGGPVPVKLGDRLYILAVPRLART